MTLRPRYEDAIPWLVEQVPELQSLLDEHLSTYGEVIPYLAFEGDFLNWFRDEFARDPSSDAARRFLDAVEVFLDSPSEPRTEDPLWTLAAVGFVENLGVGISGDNELVKALLSVAGQITREALLEEQQERKIGAEMRQHWTPCRCKEIEAVGDRAAAIYREHLVWIDGPLMGAPSIYRCPSTRLYWGSSNGPDGAVVLRRYDDLAQADAAIKA